MATITHQAQKSPMQPYQIIVANTCCNYKYTFHKKFTVRVTYSANDFPDQLYDCWPNPSRVLSTSNTTDAVAIKKAP